MKNEVKLTFIQKVLLFLNGGEEAVINNILKVASKKWAKQIALKKRAIKDVSAKLVEILEEQEEYKADELTAYKESFLNIDAEIKGRDNVVAYVDRQYEQQIANAKNALDKRNSLIEKFIADAASAINALEKEIKTYEDFLLEIE